MTFMFNKQVNKKKSLDELLKGLTVSQEAEDDLDDDFGDLGLDDDAGSTDTEEQPSEGSDEETSTDSEETEEKPEGSEEELKEVDPLEEKEITGEEETIDETTEENDSEKEDAIAVQPISNEPKPLIFLAGTCSGSNWRDKFMDELKDAPFNPYIKDIEWTPQAAQNEVAMRNAAAKIVFGITPKQKGPLTIFELGVSIMASPDRTVVMILDEDEGDTWSEHTKKAIDVIRASCEAQKVSIFDNPEQCIAFLNGEGEDFNNELSKGSSDESSTSEGSTEEEEDTSSDTETEENDQLEEETTTEEETEETKPEEVDVSEGVEESSDDEGSEDSASPDDI